MNIDKSYKKEIKTNAKCEYVDIKDLAPDMILAMDIGKGTGPNYISKGNRLHEHSIKIIETLGYEKILIYKDLENYYYYNFLDAQDDLEDEEKLEVIVRQEYEINKIKFKSIVQDIGNGIPLNEDIVTDITQSIVKNTYTNLSLELLEQAASKEDDLYSHSINTGILSALSGKWLGFDDRSIFLLTKAGILHDIGKAKISKKILNKKGEYTKEEQKLLKRHCEFGYYFLRNIPNMEKEVIMVALMHHERVDGKGYPLGIKGDKITRFSKIVTIANLYCNMLNIVTKGINKSVFSILEHLENKGADHLDITYLRTFLFNIASSYIGNTVILNTGEKAKIIYINNHSISRPLVRTEKTFINLAKTKDLKIVKLLPLLHS